jgi:hypothetical protein
VKNSPRVPVPRPQGKRSDGHPVIEMTIDPHLPCSNTRYLPGSEVEPIPNVDQGDLDDQSRRRFLIVVQRGLVPNLVWCRVRPRPLSLVTASMSASAARSASVKIAGLFRGDQATSISVDLRRHNDACVRRW